MLEMIKPAFQVSQTRATFLVVALFVATGLSLALNLSFLVYFLNICALCIIVNKIYISSLQNSQVPSHWMMVCLAVLINIICNCMWFFYMVAVTKIQEHEYQYLFISNLAPSALILVAVSSYFYHRLRSEIKEYMITIIDMVSIFATLLIFCAGMIFNFDYTTILQAPAPFTYFLVIVANMLSLFVVILAFFSIEQISIQRGIFYLMLGTMIFSCISILDAYLNLTDINLENDAPTLPYKKNISLVLLIVPYFIYMLGSFSTMKNERLHKGILNLSASTCWIPLLLLVPIAFQIKMDTRFIFAIIFVLTAHALISHYAKASATARKLLEKEQNSHNLLKQEMEQQNTQQSLTNLKLRDMLNKDNLTGLSNRSFLMYELANMLRRGEYVGLYYINVDKFKIINRTFGHHIGDRILKNIAKSLLNLVEEEADNQQNYKGQYVVARFGADEFVLIKKLHSKDEYHEFASEILNKLAEVFHIDDFDFELTYKIGACDQNGKALKIPTDEATAEMLRRADKALHFIKLSEKSEVCFYSDEVNAKDDGQIKIEKMLREADFERDFEIYFQPVFNLKTKQIISAEALLRWNHHSGQMEAKDFISIAQNSDFGNILCNFSAEQTINTLAKWQKEGLKLPKIGINVMYRQILSPMFVTDLKLFLHRSGLGSEVIEIEFSEEVWQQPKDILDAVFDGLSETGIDVCIDEFGAGRSSIAYIREYKIQRLKIAHQIVEQALKDKTEEQILSALINIGRVLNIRTTAKGVIDERCLPMLERLGCDEAMGYALGLPMRADEFKEFLRLNSHRIITPNPRKLAVLKKLPEFSAEFVI